MKQVNTIFNGTIFNATTTSLIILCLMILNFQCVFAHGKSDSFNFNQDLNKLLSNTKLVKEIESTSSRNRNKSKAKRARTKIASKKRTAPKLVQKAVKPKVAPASTSQVFTKKDTKFKSFNYSDSIVYQSKISLEKQSKLRSFRTVLNELGIVNSNISSPIKHQFATRLFDRNFTNQPTILAQTKSTTSVASATDKTPKKSSIKQKNYWATLHFIESSSGKRLYRKRNKARSCKWTTTPCGHHQLSVQALKDIGCKSLKCRSAREDYKQSLSMSKKLEKINAERMKKKGHNSLPEYQRYLVHQQGAAGLGRILNAYKGKKKLSKKTLKYMANNSPYSYKNLRRSGSRGAARKFLHHWEEKWKVNNSRRIVSR